MRRLARRRARNLAGWAVAAGLGCPLALRAADPDPAVLLAARVHPFRIEEAALSGPGWEVLKAATAGSQFVLLGEGHEDKQTPLFARALFRALQAAHGFDRVALEQDPLAMELACAPERRGDVRAVAALSKRYPTLFEFSSDQDLAFIADACAAGRGPSPVWGLEQALCPELCLEELEGLAPSLQVKVQVADLLRFVRGLEKERRDYAKFLHDDPGSEERLRALQQAFGAGAGSRADLLLSGLVKSAEIFGYNRRAGQGEWVGLLNNTVREAEFKVNFVRRYREAVAAGAPPRVLFKFGSWHMYRGRSPGAAFTIANLAHELAVFNGHDAYGLLVLPGTAVWGDLEAWMRPLLPSARPPGPVLVDLRPLRPYQRLFRLQVDEKDQWQLRDLINAFDAIVVLPEGPEAERNLTGFPKLGS